MYDPKPIDQVIQDARAAYYKESGADPKYEHAFVLGWLKSNYQALYTEYIRRNKKGKCDK